MFSFDSKCQLAEFPPIFGNPIRKTNFPTSSIHSPARLPTVDRTSSRTFQQQRFLQHLNSQNLNIITPSLLSFNDVITWFSKCNQSKQKNFLNNIICSLCVDEQKRLATILEPIFHRDYALKLLHRYPSAGVKRSYSRRDKSSNAKIEDAISTDNNPRIDNEDTTTSDPIVVKVDRKASAIPQSTEKQSQLKERYDKIMDNVLTQLGSWSVEAAEYEVHFNVDDEYPPFSLKGSFVQSKIRKEAEKQVAQLSSSGVFRDFTQYPIERGRGRRIGHEDSSSDEEYFGEGLSQKLRLNKFKTKSLKESVRDEGGHDGIHQFFSKLSATEKCSLVVELIRISPLDVIFHLGNRLKNIVEENIGFLDMPDKTIYQIFCYLDIKSLLSVSQVCKRWNYLSSLDQLWMNKCLELGLNENLWNILNIIRRNGSKSVIDKDEVDLVAKIEPSRESKSTPLSKMSPNRKSSTVRLQPRYSVSAGHHFHSKPGSKRKRNVNPLSCRLLPPDLPAKKELSLLDNPVLHTDGNLYRVDWKRAYVHLIKMVDRLRKEKSLLSSESDGEEKLTAPKLQIKRKTPAQQKSKFTSSSKEDRLPKIEILESSSSSLKKKSKTDSIASDDYIEIEDYIDRRPLMKPILGRLKQFQEAEDVAVDFRPDLKFLRDKSEKFEAKDKLRYKHELVSKRERGKALRCIRPVEFCRKLTGHLDGVLCMIFDRFRVFTGSMDQSIRMWDLCTGRSIHKFYGHKGGVLSLDYCGNFFVSGSWDTTAMVWSLLPPKFDRIKVLSEHTDSVTAVRINEDKIFTGSHDKTICVYDTKSYSLQQQFCLPCGILNIECGEGILLTSHTDRRLRLLTMNHGDVIRSFSGHEFPISSFIMSEHLIISGDKGGNLLFWDRNKEMCEAYVATGFDCPINSLFYHRGNFWTGHGDGCIREWQLSSLTCVRSLMGHKSAVTAVLVTNDKLMSCSQDATVRIWNFVNHKHKNPKPSDGYLLPSNVKFETEPPKYL